MGIVFKRTDVTKANPSKTEEYTVEFQQPEYAQYNGSVTVVFEHVNARTLAACQKPDEDGEINPTNTLFNIFGKCVKSIHGLSQEVLDKDGNVVEQELTVKDIMGFSELNAQTTDGESALAIIYAVVFQVSSVILEKSRLNETEIKN